MLGHTPAHLSTCQELSDCESPSCQITRDGWLSLASRASKTQGWERKGQKEGERSESEYQKGRFSDTLRTGPEIHPEGGHNIKQEADVFLVKYWRYVFICEAEGAEGRFRAVGRVWFLTFSRMQKPTTDSTAWGEPWAEPRLGSCLTQLHQLILSQPLPMWLLEHRKVAVWKAAPDY